MEDAWDSAPASVNTYRDELRRLEREVGLLVSKGALSSASKNSASQSYASGQGNLTTADVARAWRDLINLFDRCHQLLIDAGTASPTDDEIYFQMRARCRSIYSCGLSLTTLQRA